jgi:hypothetical protein
VLLSRMHFRLWTMAVVFSITFAFATLLIIPQIWQRYQWRVRLSRALPVCLSWTSTHGKMTLSNLLALATSLHFAHQVDSLYGQIISGIQQKYNTKLESTEPETLTWSQIRTIHILRRSFARFSTSVVISPAIYPSTDVLRTRPYNRTSPSPQSSYRSISMEGNATIRPLFYSTEFTSTSQSMCDLDGPMDTWKLRRFPSSNGNLVDGRQHCCAKACTGTQRQSLRKTSFRYVPRFDTYFAIKTN